MSIPKHWISSFDLPEPEYEYRFTPPRRYRIDVAWPAHKLAVEIEGAVWTGGRHVHPTGFIKDIEKYNLLTLEGWSLLRFTPQQVKNGEAIKTIHRWFNK